MKFSEMSTREQVLVLLVGVTVLLLLYGVLRLKPGLAELEDMQASIKKTQENIKNSKIPDLPAKSAEKLRAEMQKMDADLPKMKQENQAALARLAPPDSQELQIRISELARKNLLHIRDRRPYDGLSTALASGPSATDISRMSAKDAKRAQNRIDREMKKAMREGRKPVTPGTAPVAQEKKTEVVKKSLDDFTTPPPGSLHDLAVNLNANSAAKRPLQQFVLEGDFRSLQRFIADLEQLPWLVSVIKLDITVNGKEPPPGLPQLLTATLVLVL